MERERASADMVSECGIVRGYNEGCEARGRFDISCIAPDGSVKWTDQIENVVANVGKNYMFTQSFVTNNAIVGPFMGLISNQSYSATANGDTMSSHAGWVEAGNANTPTYTGNRASTTWAAASGGAIALSANSNFAISGTGIVVGCFIVYGTSASNAVGNNSGTLWSAGAFTGGNKAANGGDTISVSYSTSM